MIVYTTLQLDQEDNKNVGKPDVGAVKKALGEGQGAFEIFTKHGGTKSCCWKACVLSLCCFPICPAVALFIRRQLFVYTFGLSSPRHRTRQTTVRLSLCRAGFSDGRVYGLRAEDVQGK
jgi:hypothetical protein